MPCIDGDFSYHPGCQKCPRHLQALHVGIGGRGDNNPKVLFVGMNPGRDEDRENKAFVGRSGRLLQDAIDRYLTIPWRITNLARCWNYTEKTGYKKDRDPSVDEVRSCFPYLQEELERTRPSVLILLGELVLKAIMGPKRKLSEWRGIPMDTTTPWPMIAFPTYHPSYILRKMNERDGTTLMESWLKDLSLANRIAETGHTDPLQVTLHFPKTPMEFHEMLQQLIRADEIAFDVETNTFSDTPVPSLWHRGAKIISMAFAVSDTEAWAFPVEHRENQEVFKITKSLMWDEILCLLETKKWIAHGGKFDSEAIYVQTNEGVYPHDDTLLMHYCLDETIGKQSLEDLLRIYYPELVREKVGILKYKSIYEKESYEAIPLPELLRYNAYDTIATFRLKNLLEPKLKENPRIWTLYRDLMMPACHALIRIEREGLLPNLEEKRKVEASVRERFLTYKLALTQIAESFGMAEFNPNSTPQVSKLLFTHLGIPSLGKTDGGQPSTKDEFLLNARLRVKGQAKEAIDLLISHINEAGEDTDSYRGLGKLLSTYLEPFEGYIGADGKIHASYLQHGTATFRLSSKDPNAQNFPAEIKSLIMAPEGWLYWEADLDQAELRLLADLTQGGNLLGIYQEGKDIHNEVALSLFGLSPEDKPTSIQRRVAKAVNFGIVYQESANGLAINIQISVKKAQEYIDRYLTKTFPEIKTFMDARIREARDTGKVLCPFGNFRHLPGIHSPNSIIAGEAERAAGNTAIQSGIGLYTNHKMAVLAKRLDWDECKITWNEHDSLKGIVREDKADTWLPLIKAEMENTESVRHFGLNLTLPFPVEMKVGKDYKSLKEYAPENITAAVGVRLP